MPKTGSTKVEIKQFSNLHFWKQILAFENFIENRPIFISDKQRTVSCQPYKTAKNQSDFTSMEKEGLTNQSEMAPPTFTSDFTIVVACEGR